MLETQLCLLASMQLTVVCDAEKKIPDINASTLLDAWRLKWLIGPHDSRCGRTCQTQGSCIFCLFVCNTWGPHWCLHVVARAEMEHRWFNVVSSIEYAVDSLNTSWVPPQYLLQITKFEIYNNKTLVTTLLKRPSFFGLAHRFTIVLLLLCSTSIFFSHSTPSCYGPNMLQIN
jgi:hypothetical protein